jgi:hypothetical protein
VPAWLRSPASIVAASGQFLFGLEPSRRSYVVHVAPQQQVELGTLFFNTAKPFRIDGPVRAVDASAADTLRVIDGNGRVQSIAAAGVTPLTGGRSRAMAQMRLLDVAGAGDVLAAATTDGVRLYSMRNRSWSDPLAAPDGERAVEVVDRGGTWIARSHANRLLRMGPGPAVLIGGGEPMPRRPLTDARRQGPEIYLAWPGTIQRYDLRARRVTATWTFDTDGPVTLTGVIGSEPVSISAGLVRVGGRRFAGGARGMFPGGADPWSPSEERARRYLDARPLASLEQRTVVESGPLRLTRGANGAIEGALRVTDPQGRTTWMPIDLSSGRFPFDVVRSVAAAGNALYVGTDAGLQVYDAGDLALTRARTIVLADTTGASPAIDRIGEPCDGPATPIVCGPRGCARQSGSAFVAAPATALSCRARARSPFWSWQDEASGLSGRYVIAAVPGRPPEVASVALTEGQLDHDGIGQIVSFAGNTFTVWRDRYVGVHSNGVTLIGARNHGFALPVRLVAVAMAIPLARGAERDLAPGLYAIEGPRTWRYDRQTWAPVADNVAAAAIAEFAASPPLLQRRRLRLVRPALAPSARRRERPQEAPVFEMRLPAGSWTPLAWDAAAGRYAIDVWQDIAVSRQTLWTATSAGLVSRDGDWSFNPDTFRIVDLPAQEAGRLVTDLRLDGGAAELRYDAARAYRLAIEGPPRPTVRLQADPFAERTFDVDRRYWTWRMTGRTGPSAGRLAGEWKGESISLANGRFDFDAINSMAFFQGQIHVATNTRGWFALPVDSAALEQWSRPNQSSVPAIDVVRLHGNHDPDEAELCLQGVDGQFARFSPNGSSRRTQGCPVLAARTGFWRYTRDGSTLRVLPAAGAARPGERRLVDGRFTDEVITGAPVSGRKDGRPVTLVPTAAAVMWWDGSGRVVDMQAPPFQGKPDAPRLLQWSAGGSPAYVADGTLYSLDSDDKPRGSWTLRLPPKALFERLSSGPGPLLSIDWSEDGRRHHSVVDPRNSSVSHDDIPIDARRIPAYFQRAMTDQSHDGLIRLRLRDHVISAYATGEGWPIVETDDSFQLLAGVSRGTRAILVGPHHLIELNMERIARAVYSGDAPPPPPAAGKKK